MTQEKTKETFNQIVKQGQNLVEKGNQRHVVIRDAEGQKIVDLTGTLAVIIMAGLLLFQPIGGLIMAAGFIYGVTKRLKIEFLRNVNEEDSVVEMQIPQEDA